MTDKVIEAKRLKGGDFEIWHQGEVWAWARIQPNGPRPATYRLVDSTNHILPRDRGSLGLHGVIIYSGVTRHQPQVPEGWPVAQIIGKVAECIADGRIKPPPVLRAEIKARADKQLAEAEATRAKWRGMRAAMLSAWWRAHYPERHPDVLQGLADVWAELFPGEPIEEAARGERVVP